MVIVNSVSLCGYLKHPLPSTDIRRFVFWAIDLKVFGVRALFGLGLGVGVCGIDDTGFGASLEVDSLRKPPETIVVPPTRDCDRWEPSWPPAQPGPMLHEMSGMAQSSQDKSLLYHVTDSGNDPMIFVTDFDGKLERSVRYRGAAWDVEALGKGPCPWGGTCVFPADIGDNLRWRVTKRIDAVEEKSLWGGPIKAESLEFKLPGQLVLDMEALAVHPFTGDIFLFSKERKVSRVFRLPSSVWKRLDEIHIPEYVGDIGLSMVADAAFSRDGKRLVLTATNGIIERSEEPQKTLRHVGGWYPYERDLHLPRLDQQEAVTYLDDDRSVAYSSEKKILRHKNWGIVVARCTARDGEGAPKK